MVKKTGLVLIIIGICLPTATLPFITEFRPVPELCLTSNFFNNMGNMVVAFGVPSGSMVRSEPSLPMIAVPYRYVFSLGVVLVCTGLIFLVLSAGKRQTAYS